MRINPCVWQLVPDMLCSNAKLWKPECKLMEPPNLRMPNMHCFGYSPIEYGFKYCPFCGRYIQESLKAVQNG